MCVDTNGIIIGTIYALRGSSLVIDDCNAVLFPNLRITGYTNAICSICKADRGRTGNGRIDRRGGGCSGRCLGRRLGRCIGLSSRVSCTAIAALGGSGHIFGNVTVKDLPRQFRVVDKDISVALNLTYNLITTQLPSVYGVKLAPSKKNVYALKYIGNFVAGKASISTVSGIHIQTNSCYVALDIVQRLEITAA